MSRLERLLNLTAALLAAERPLTREELRERVPGYPPEKASFRRQFERDKDALRELGLPLRTVPLSGQDGDEPQVGYRIPGDEYYLRDPGLAADELAALHLAARVVRIEGLDDADAIWKLGAEEPVLPAVGDVAADAPVAAATLPAGSVLAPVFAAIAGGRRIRFDYRGEPRSVVPRTLSFRNGHWYLVGHDLDRQESRSFRTDRFTSAVEQGAAVDDDALGLSGGDDERDAARRGEELVRPWELGSGEPTRATVRIDADQAAWAALHLGDDAVVGRGEDGSVTLGLDVRSVDAFRSFVLGFLDHAEVLGPAMLRDDVVGWLQALAEAG